MSDTIVITENYFDALALGEVIFVKGVYIALQPNKEIELINAVENKLVKEYGLDGEEEEK